MMPDKKVAVLYHIFYEDTIIHISDELKYLSSSAFTFFFNISSDMPGQAQVKKRLLKIFPGAYIITSSNKGKDIGGKLLLLNLCKEADVKPEWIIFLHDKKSLQALQAKTWKSDLLTIIDKDQIERIFKIISEDSTCGIVAAANYVRKEIADEDGVGGKNGILLSRLVNDYAIKPGRYEYVAGTMFWAKALPLLTFFERYSPLKIRTTLEDGNVVDNFAGTNTHSWERMLSWIVLSEGLNIKTI